MRARHQSVIVVLLTLLFLTTGLSRSAGLAHLRVSFIDVGQGDSILVQTADGFDALIDGGRPAAGPTVVAFLRQSSVNTLEVMVATHADADHIGGLIDVLNASDIEIGQVLYNGYAGTTATWDTFVAAAQARGLTLTAANFPADYVWGGGVTAQVLHPDAGLTAPDQNESSVVMLIRQGDIRYLMTGDIGHSAEATVVARGTPIAANVLKVGHHGSKNSTSSAFLAAVSPAEAMITVGDNSYGHPTEETLAKLAAVGVRIWRTDQLGTIWVNSDGHRWVVNEDLPLDDFVLLYLPLVVAQRPPDPTPTPTATYTPTPTPTPTATNLPLPTMTPTPTPTTPAASSDLRITTLSGESTPEYVIVQNFGAGAQDMTGWKLYSVVGPQTFNFPSGYVLGPGAQVRIESFTGAGNNPPSVLLWGLAAIWRNSGDKAWLQNSGGVTVSCMAYGSESCP